MCAPYRTEGDPDFSVATSLDDIEAEATSGQSFPSSYLETLAVYRKIAERMPLFDGFLMHGSCIAVDDSSYVFCAPSGTGKSTHTALWRRLLGERAEMVNDDKPLVRFSSGTAYVYGTPWDGKHHLSCNMSVPLKSVCFLERSETNSIRELSFSEALPFLIRHVYRPSDPVALEKTLGLLKRLDIRFYNLRCNMEISAAKLSYSAMGGSCK